MPAQNRLSWRWQTPQRVENGALCPLRRRLLEVRAHFTCRIEGHCVSLPHAGSGGGCRLSRSIRCRISSNSLLGIATLASWTTTYRPCRTIRAPIFTSFSHNIVSDQCSTCSRFTRVAMELAWAPGHPARRASAVHRLAVEQIMIESLEKVGAASPQALARDVILLIEGAMVLRLIHGDEAWINAAENAALTLSRRYQSSPRDQG